MYKLKPKEEQHRSKKNRDAKKKQNNGHSDNGQGRVSPISIFQQPPLGKHSNPLYHTATAPHTNGRSSSPGLSGILERLAKNNPEVTGYLDDDNKTTHEYPGSKNGTNGIVITTSFIDVDGYFQNEYSKNKWIMKQNIRSKESPFFMNDVVRKQYTIASREGAYYGCSPDVIRRDNIINEDTLAVLKKNDYSVSDHAMREFLSKTPNGKSTQRIMDDFQMDAWKMDIFRQPGDEPGEEQVSVEIHVRERGQSEM